MEKETNNLMLINLLNEQIVKHGQLKFGNEDNGRIFIGFDENHQICSYKVFGNGIIEKLEYIMVDKDKRINELYDAAMELYNLVHESDLIQNKIRANELYDVINNHNPLKDNNSKDNN